MPKKLVEKIDAEAEKNYRDRTGEIINAIMGYYQLEKEKKEILEIMGELSKKVEALEKEVNKLKS